ncbi:uncharacterized protein N7496_009588 [Penicillium cataractarum]|uniref:Uncharacterized protein n=1 Tax=Penicillium cataractarum TaxID=2100454 RepID=A0A9W9RP87_9EURO|nr:uncharacterized protein N7496_009588 [Penicillium cataractarum]KAJ5363875.1 hypothetical protein N7496_009588 [Penicillium cataractarum]
MSTRSHRHAAEPMNLEMNDWTPCGYNKVVSDSNLVTVRKLFISDIQLGNKSDLSDVFLSVLVCLLNSSTHQAALVKWSLSSQWFIAVGDSMLASPYRGTSQQRREKAQIIAVGMIANRNLNMENSTCCISPLASR